MANDYLNDEGPLPRPGRTSSGQFQNPSYSSMESLAKRAAFDAQTAGADDKEKFLANMEGMAALSTHDHIQEAVGQMTHLVREVPASQLRKVVGEIQEIIDLYQKESIAVTTEEKAFISDVGARLIAFCLAKSTLFERMKSSLKNTVRESAAAGEGGVVGRMAKSQSFMLRAAAKTMTREAPTIDAAEKARLDTRASTAGSIVSGNAKALDEDTGVGSNVGKKGEALPQILDTDKQILGELKKENENWELDKESKERDAEETKKPENKPATPERIREDEKKKTSPLATLFDSMLSGMGTVFKGGVTAMTGLFEFKGLKLIFDSFLGRMPSVPPMSPPGPTPIPKNEPTPRGPDGRFQKKPTVPTPTTVNPPAEKQGMFGRLRGVAGRGMNALGAAAATEAIGQGVSWGMGELGLEQEGAAASEMTHYGAAGAALGSWFGGIGAVPGAIIGTGVGGYKELWDQRKEIGGAVSDLYNDQFNKSYVPTQSKPTAPHPEARIGAAPPAPARVPHAEARMSAAAPGTAQPVRESLHMSENGLDALMHREGYIDVPYWDVDHWAIGYGDSQLNGVPLGSDPNQWGGFDPKARVKKAKNPTFHLTQAQAEAMLRTRLTRFENIVRRPGQTQPQFDALVSVAYNSEAAGKKLANRAAAGESLASSDFLGSATVKGERNASLEVRRRAEYEQFVAPTRTALAVNNTGASQTNIVVAAPVTTIAANGGGAGMIIPQAPITTGHPDETLMAMRRAAPLD